MKVSTLALAVAQLAFAQDDEEPGEKRLSSIIDMVWSQVDTGLSWQDFEKRIQNYGCHCFPHSSKAAGGTGEAVDSMDLLCRKLYRCHKCVELEKSGCDPHRGNYRHHVEDNGDGTNTIVCDNINDTDEEHCKMAQCLCDADFAYQMGEVYSDMDYNTFFWLNPKWVRQQNNNGNPVMDYDATCTIGGVHEAPDMCCGDDFPNKAPYFSGARSCCASSGRTYNTISEKCCDNGDILPIGSC